jgi:urease subunit gamma/beta
VNLTSCERDRLVLLHRVAGLASQRRARGLALGYPEALALICTHVLEGAREGRGVAELTESARHILRVGDVLPGVPELIRLVHVEASFPDGTKLVSVHDPLGAGLAEQPRPRGRNRRREAAAGRARRTLRVESTADRPIEVAEHDHFYDAHRALRFDRAAAYGMRLDIPAGTSTCFYPGEARTVELVGFDGHPKKARRRALGSGPVPASCGR